MFMRPRRPEVFAQPQAGQGEAIQLFGAARAADSIAAAYCQVAAVNSNDHPFDGQQGGSCL